MHINESIGIFYDMIYYNLIYFNRKSLELKYPGLNYDREAFFINYDTLRRARNHLDPPPQFFPFFCFYNDKPCVMSEFFQDAFDFFHDTIDSFLAKLSDKASFKRFVYSYYLSDFLEQLSLDEVLRRDGESIGKALALLSKRIDIEQFTYMFYHFNEVINSLVTYLNQLKPFIEAFHSTQKNKIQVVQDFISEDNQAMVRKCCPDRMDDLVHFESQTYSVSLLNKYLIVRQKCADKNKHAFLLGYDCCSLLSQIVNYRYITIYSVIKSYGNDTKLEIIRELSKKEMTISQLSRKLHLSRSSIGRYVEDLVEEVAIVRVKKVGADIYLRLNPEYFIQSKSAFINYVDTILFELCANIE